MRKFIIAAVCDKEICGLKNVMNDTKWNEIFKAFYYENELKENSMLIIWRTKEID